MLERSIWLCSLSWHRRTSLLLSSRVLWFASLWWLSTLGCTWLRVFFTHHYIAQSANWQTPHANANAAVPVGVNCLDYRLFYTQRQIYTTSFVETDTGYNLKLFSTFSKNIDFSYLQNILLMVYMSQHLDIIANQKRKFYGWLKDFVLFIIYFCFLFCFVFLFCLICFT